jgi:hypothetical protein
MAKKNPTPKRKPVSPDLLQKLVGSVKKGTAFPNKLKAPDGFADKVIEKLRATKPPNRSKKHQLVFRISDELAKELRDGAFTARKSQTEIVEEALETALQALRVKHGNFLDADAS